MIYLVRHGQTVWNRTDRRQGHRDSPLTLKGIAQAQSVGHLFNDLLSDDSPPIMSSPLGHAYQAAEVSYGRWEGLPTAQIRKTDPDVWAHRQTNRWSIAAPSGESNTDLQQRIGSWLSEQNDIGDIIVVGHGALNRAFIGLVAGLTSDQALALPEDHRECLPAIRRIL